MRTILDRPVLLGVLGGLAWTAGLRGFMAQVAGFESNVTWSLTFGWLLVPGVVVGALLGWAEHIRRAGGRPRWRWLALAPLAYAGLLFSDPTDILGIFEDGLGAGAIAVPLIGMAGGHAISGRGPLWARLATGLVAVAPVPIWALTASSIGPHLALDTPRGAWVAVYHWSFLAVLYVACAIPHRPVVPAASGADRSAAASTV